MAQFGHVITAMATPFDREGRVDYERAAELARRLTDHGSESLVVAGTTGESPTLSDQEKVELFRTVKQAVGERAKVIAGTGTYDTAHSIHLSREAERAGADGLLLVNPYYNRPSQEGLYAHFRTVAESTALPVILYNIPGRTGVNCLPETVARLAQVPNIVAIKEASGSLDQASEVRKRTPPHFLLYSGDDSLTLPMLAVGGVGVVSVASHLVGEEIGQMIRAFLAGEVRRALEIHLRLWPLFKVLFITTNPVPLKAALRLAGFDVGAPRLPLVEATPREQEQIRGVLQDLALLPVAA
ncbi:MAG: 4-hydroxy-tetrahydrodipicolinate synthase [Armatimonadota bacterium]|nr:4-hydroxy-tetrahydrodipicolinate synthase [Armatimonadota bacterium]MDR7426846.1 4-hydroxy-tetrahydrodipicolinate synthase [Armatimonadota bacterium]MDR7464486.1 4-hydroxy-tetrahydrodipicolinate synthase [Armatimonadota bacterium]MDR7468793.1 4-hydroxy-tetrahydrodipicolinate synthase [Armatimonadota bacterium]MDR7473686.1 4-hydroxy-tetrahydrodipicolinate synthase [Armatimonadota bacterium]